MAEARITIEVRDDAGGIKTGTGTVVLESPPAPLPPIIDSIVLNPTTLPSTGGMVMVTVTAHSPSGRPLTYTAATANGSAQPDAQQKHVFHWTVPPAP